jgi:AraC-like DNA-binding protein
MYVKPAPLSRSAIGLACNLSLVVDKLRVPPTNDTVHHHVLAEMKRCIIGIPLYAYQIQLRVMRAKNPLLSGLPTSEVASLVGFYDQSHLGRHFRKLVGVSRRICGPKMMPS